MLQGTTKLFLSVLLGKKMSHGGEAFDFVCGYSRDPCGHLSGAQAYLEHAQ